MSEKIPNNKNVRDDEIDLLDLLSRMGKKLNRLGHYMARAFLISTVFVIKRWFILSISIFLAVVGSYILKMVAESSYTSDMILRTNAVSPSDLIPFINRLHAFCVDNNKLALKSALFSTDEQVDNISDIRAYWVIDKGRDNTPDEVDYKDNHDLYDTVNVRMQDRLDIRVKIKAPQELNLVRDGIIKFIISDSLFQQKNRIRLRQNLELLTRLNYDILQLDSLQKVKYFEETKNRQPQNGGQMIFLQEQKTQLVYPEIHDLYFQKQQLEGERDLYKDIVTVISEFTLPARRDNGGLYYGKYLVPSFFFITLLMLILLANRKKLKEVYNKY
jgi:hypothetical protein